MASSRGRRGGGGGKEFTLTTILACIGLFIWYGSTHAGIINQLINGPSVSPPAATSTTGPSKNQQTNTSGTNSGVTPPAGTYTLVQEPEVGLGPIYNVITNAKKTLDMTMYELNDPIAQNDLIADQKRGVKVRIILDKDFTGGKVNAPAYNALQAAGVEVHWAPAGTIYHQKTITADNSISVIGTANLTAQYYASSRDAWIIDTYPAHVNAIEQTFQNDLNVTNGTGASAQTPGLLWSPQAVSGMVTAISAAKTSVDYTSEELADPDVINALAADAKRGVKCEIVLTDSKSWAPGFATVTAAGCSVHVFANNASTLYIHEKIVLTDGSDLLIGSQNASVASLTYNRELSVSIPYTAAPNIIDAVKNTFETDYSNASPWHN